MKKREYIVADAILDVLKAHGVSTIFWYPGGAILPFYDALPFHDIKHVLVRNEQGGAFAAQWWARSRKELWVCCATSGPGATNIVTWIFDAYLDSIPLLAITWQVPLWVIGTDAFQECDMTWVTMSITKHNYLVDKAEDIVHIMTEAIAIATSGRPWPVHVDVPKDIMASPHPEKFSIPKIELKDVTPNIKAYHPVSMEKIDELVKEINSAKKPILLVGQWIKHSNAEREINELITKIWIPTVSTLLAKWIVKSDNPDYLGMVWMHWFYHVNRAVDDTDLILNIGSRFDDRIVGRYDAFWKNAKIIHVDIDKSELGKVVKPDYPIHSDALNFIKQILTHPDLKKLEIDPWKKKINTWKKECPFDTNPKWFTVRNVLSAIMSHIGENLDDHIIVTDVWQHQMWTSLSCSVSDSSNWLSSWWAGTMWFSLPSSIWAAFANPDKTIICIAWDGSIQMNIQELMLLNKHKLNIKVFVLNNNFLWMVRQWQELFYDNNISQTTMMTPDFVKLAEWYWIGWTLIEWKDGLKKHLKKIIDDDGPELIEVKVQPNDNVFPMVPWWKTLWEVITKA